MVVHPCSQILWSIIQNKKICIPFEAEDACGYRVRVRVAIEGRHTESSKATKIGGSCDAMKMSILSLASSHKLPW